MKWLKRFSLGTVALAVVLLAIVATVLNTEWGARFVMQRLAPVAPGELRAREVAGTLAGPLILDGFEYRLGRIAVSAERLRLDAALLDLMTGGVRVERAGITGLELVVAPEPPGREPASGPVALPAVNLPVAIEIESLTVDGARFQLPGAEPVALEGIDLRGRFAGGRLELEHLDVGAPSGRLSLGGRVDTTERYATELAADVVLARPGEDLAARIALRGDLDRLAVNVTGQPPVAARLQATFTGLPWPPALEAELDLEAVEPAALGLGGVPGPLTGWLAVSGGPGELDLQGWLAAGAERLEIRRLTLARDGARLALEALELTGPEGARLAADGALDLGGETPEITLDADWESVAVPLPDGRALASPVGHLALSGQPADYRATGRIRIGGAVPEGAWELEGRGDLERFELERLEGETLGGALTLEGAVAWRPEVAWNLQAVGQGLDPAGVAPPWRGRLGFRARSEGRLASSGPAGTLELESLTGTLRGRELSGAASVEFRGLETAGGRATFESGDSRLRAQGRLADTVDLRVSARVAEAGDWHPAAAGSLQGEWRVTGRRSAPRISGELRGEKLALGEHRVGNLRLSADAGLGGGADPGRVRLRLERTVVAGVPVGSVEAIARGTRADHELELEAGDGTRRLALALAGRLGDGQWDGRLTALTLAGPRVGDWRLREAVSLSVSPGRGALSRLCLEAAAGQLCAGGEWDPDAGLRAAANLDGVPLALGELALRPLVKRPLELSGRLDLEADLRLPPGERPVVEARFAGQEAGVALSSAEGMTRFALSPLRGRLSLRDRRMQAGARVGLDRAGSVDLALESAAFDPAAWHSAPLSGRVGVALDDLSPLGPLTGPVAAPSGALRGELRLDGALGSLGLGGTLALSDFSAQLPRAGIRLERGRMKLEAGGGALAFDGRAASGEGELRVEGRLGLDPDGALTGEARVRGERFLAVDRPGLQARVSPDLALALDGRSLDITGSVEVPAATVDAGELQGGGVAPSPDVIVAGDEPVRAPPPIRWRAEVDVVLGEDIALRAPGFEGSADGRLHVSDRYGRAPLGQGQLSVSGSYEAYGQQLAIRRGRLLFSDTPLDNPALDVTAVRETRDVTAGVRIAGTARQPQLTLFSEPPLGSESQILSYLILGRPMNSLSSSEGATLTGAAASLGIKGGGLLAQRIGARFGLEEVEVGRSEALGQSALTLGKYLSPRLYIGYGVGLIEPVSVVRLRYELSEHWAVEAASGKETTAAVKFNYER